MILVLMFITALTLSKQTTKPAMTEKVIHSLPRECFIYGVIEDDKEYNCDSKEQ